MKNSSKSLSRWLMLGTISLLAVSALLVPQITQAQASPVLQQQAATATPASGSGDGGSGTQTASVVQIWDQFCVRKIPYTLLAMPQGATFDAVQPQVLPTPIPGYSTADQLACTSVGTFRDKQVVVCRGPQSISFTLKVNNSGATEDFQVPLKECPLPKPAP